jgi:hypothetical protein
MTKEAGNLVGVTKPHTKLSDLFNSNGNFLATPGLRLVVVAHKDVSGSARLHGTFLALYGHRNFIFEFRELISLQ